VRSGWRLLALTCYWLVAAAAAVVFLGGALIGFTRVHLATDGTPSMENTILPGDKLIYLTGSDVRRGDLVLARIGPAARPLLLVWRVIGLPGDRVACCTAQGRVTVNGRALDETYVYPGEAPSRPRFSVRLGPGEAWLMGDKRAVSDDSRYRGPVPLTRLVGRVTMLDRRGRLMAVRTPRTFVADGLAPPDHRLVVPVAWIIGAAAAVLCALLLLGGLVAWIRGRIVRRRARAAAPVADGAADGAALS